MRLGLIWAQSRNGVIGAGGAMPWHISEDMAHFKAVTGTDAVVMGRHTWDSLPERFRPLAGRRNIVVTRQVDWHVDGVEVAHTIEDALNVACGDSEGSVWVIGGAQLYSAVIGRADLIEVTEIDADVDGDTFAPEIPAAFVAASVDPDEGWHISRTGVRYRWLRYLRSS